MKIQRNQATIETEQPKPKVDPNPGGIKFENVSERRKGVLAGIKARMKFEEYSPEENAKLTEQLNREDDCFGLDHDGAHSECEECLAMVTVESWNGDGKSDQYPMRYKLNEYCRLVRKGKFNRKSV